MGGRCQPYKTNFFQSLPKLPFHTPPLPPIRATCTNFLDVKNDVLARITEPSNNDYDNDGSDGNARKKTFFYRRCSLRVQKDTFTTFFSHKSKASVAGNKMRV